VIDLLEAAYSADAAIALCEHLLFSPAGLGGEACSGADSNGSGAAAGEGREAKLREVTLKCARAHGLPCCSAGPSLCP
jgi:hypothetical protein